MWGPGPWGAGMWGLWWVFPLLGLLFMVVMMGACFRMMRGMMGGGGMCGRGGDHPSSMEDLRREVRALREEIKQLKLSKGTGLP